MAERRRKSDPAGLRDRIVDEAKGLIGRDGFHRFTVEDLAARCGVSKGGLLHHFRSKERLLLAVLEECDRRDAECLKTALRLKSDDDMPKDRGSLADLLAMMLSALAAKPEQARLYAVLRAEALNAAHPAHGYFARRERMALDVFGAICVVLGVEPEPAARQLHALSDGLILQWLSSGEGFDLAVSWKRAFCTVLPMLRNES